MKGVVFRLDKAGNATEVTINVRENPELREDIHDRALVRRRAHERRESLESVRRRMAARCRRAANG